MNADPLRALDPTLPLALLPLRVEARYLPRGGDPTHLCVRIFPDVIHSDAHRPWLSPRENALGRQFWTALHAARDSAEIAEARRWLAAQVGPYRALCVSTMLRPVNLGAGDAAPKFPRPRVSDEVAPMSARLLPDSFIVRLYDQSLALAHSVTTRPVPARLAMAPTLAAVPSDAEDPATGRPLSAPEAFLRGQGLLWMQDFDEAVRIGMGVRIPIAAVPSPVGALLVLGARTGRDPLAEGTALDELLAAHWYTRGLDLVPQGTPTNNTDAGATSVSLDAPDTDLLFEREASERPIAPAGRAASIVRDPALLHRLPNADAASLALGRVRANAIDRTEHASLGEGLAAWAMNLAIGYATFGRYLSGPLSSPEGSTITGDLSGAFRDWYTDWVRGGGPLPVLRCGEPPYGLLPITSRPKSTPGAFPDFAARVEHHVAALCAHWRAALPVAALDPDATDSRPAATSASQIGLLAEVLAAVPHPTELRLRRATSHLADDTEAFAGIAEQMDRYVEEDGWEAHGATSELALWWPARRSAIFGARGGPPPSVATQLSNVDIWRSQVELADGRASYETRAPAILALIDDELRPLLETYWDAKNEAPPILRDWNDTPGLGSTRVVRLLGTTFSATTEPVGELVARGRSIDEVRAFLTDMIAAMAAAEADATPPSARARCITQPAPLLQQLLDATWRTAPVDQLRSVRAAVGVLRAVLDRSAGADPIAELERLLRESLGLAMYRLDAWVTSIATERLARRRRSRPAGIQIGSYGLLLDLRRSDDPPSQGFVHAPSLDQAAAAAVLRSGYAAYGTRSGDAPLAVDLSSARVRGGQWILDAVRNGQDLAAVLGARIERYLHDARLDDWIATIRRAVSGVDGDRARIDRVVDGLLVARAYADVDRTEREAAARSRIDARLASHQQRSEVERILRRVADDLDAVADLLLADTVFAVLQRRHDAAAAALAATGGRDGAVPPISVSQTQREVRRVHHRVIAVWPVGDAPPDREGRVLWQAAPQLCAWLDTVLPDPADVVARIRVGAESTGVASYFSLAELGASAAELAMLAGPGTSQRASSLGEWIRASIVGVVGPDLEIALDLDPAADGSLPPGTITVDEFGLAATAMRDAVGRARPLRAEDLLPPGEESNDAQIDRVELRARVEAAVRAARGVITALGDADASTRRAAWLQAAVLGATTRTPPTEDADSATRELIAAVEERLAPHDPPADPDATALSLLARLVGGRLPILRSFVPPADADRVRSAQSALRRQQISESGDTWLRRAGRVRADLGAMIDALLLSDTLRGPRERTLGLAQLPDEGGAWAAVGAPTGDGDRLCLVSLTGENGLSATGPISGLLVDQLTEGIPRDDHQTGVAIHFDAPSARPPQAVLLSVVPDGAELSTDEVADQILHTIELAKLRAVGPDRVVGLGQYLPAVFLPGDTRISQEES